MSHKASLNSMVRLIARADLQSLMDALHRQGYRSYGPTLQNNSIIYEQLSSVEDIPAGWCDHQSGGTYRLEETSRPHLFDYHLGPQSWKKFLYPASKQLWQAERHHSSFRIAAETSEPPRRAFIGVRPCELRAIQILDNVLCDGPYTDPVYCAARARTFTVVVNCTSPGDTCFCASMEAGPRATSGFDLALTELVDSNRHVFVAEACSKRGAKILEQVPASEATTDDLRAVDEKVAAAAAGQSRSVNLENIQLLLNSNTEHPEWEKVARRCLSCGNCTLVCPTCFCTNVRDYTDLGGSRAWRQREWDSCFTVDFSYIFGGSIRNTGKSRYRQWMTHKLGNWIGQFGHTGCVGCGRCITWCPVGIDITEEARAIRDGQQVVGVSIDKREAENGES